MGTANEPLNVRSLVDQHYTFVYRYAYRLSGSVLDAEDLTQETFCTAQAKFHQLREPSSARAWLCAILRSHYLRRARRNSPSLFQSLDDLPDEPQMDATAALPDGVDDERLQQLLAEMPEAYRTPIILFYFEEFSYREIAEQMGVPIGTVMSRLARGKAHLRCNLRTEAVEHRLSPSPGE